jgi:hypothetical protein
MLLYIPIRLKYGRKATGVTITKRTPGLMKKHQPDGIDG